MEEPYPNLTKMCRLCLQENAGVVPIFPSDDGHKLSLSVRIMAVVAQEVSNSDDMPKFLCHDCRYQLEKSYVFRKRSQQSDNRLRNHLRLLSMGRKSKVFAKSEDNDYLMAELEFEESLSFIKQQDDQRAALDREMLKQELLADIDEEQIRATLRSDLRLELRGEVMEECQRVERERLLDELGDFLCNKRLQFNDNKRIHSKRRKEDTHCSTKRNERTILNSVTAPKKTINLVNSDSVEGKGDSGDDDLQDNEDFVDHHEDFDSNADAQTNDKIVDATKSIDEIDYYSHNVKSAKETPTLTEKATSYQIENFKIRLNQMPVARDGVPGKNDNVMIFNIEQNAENGQMDMVELITPDVLIMGTDEDKNENAGLNNSKTIDNGISDTSATEIISCSELSKLINSKSEENELLIPLENETSKKIASRTTDTLKTFKCTICPKEFSTEHSLKRHLNAHRTAEEKGISYQCAECHVFLSCKSALSRHMFTHSGKKAYTCQICNKSFVQREILTRHMQIHTGSRAHKCSHCPRTFTQRINLTHHINRTHIKGANVVTHRCHLCSKSFSHASGLSRHLLHHSGIAYSCNACNRQFGDRSSVKRHIQNLHGIIESDEITKYICKAKDTQLIR